MAFGVANIPTIQLANQSLAVRSPRSSNSTVPRNREKATQLVTGTPAQSITQVPMQRHEHCLHQTRDIYVVLPGNPKPDCSVMLLALWCGHSQRRPRRACHPTRVAQKQQERDHFPGGRSCNRYARRNIERAGWFIVAIESVRCRRPRIQHQSCVFVCQHSRLHGRQLHAVVRQRGVPLLPRQQVLHAERVHLSSRPLDGLEARVKAQDVTPPHHRTRV